MENQILSDEYKKISDDIRSLEGKYEKILTVGTSLIGILSFYGVKENIVVLNILLPYTLLYIMAYVSMCLRSIALLGYYKSKIETKLNRLAGKDILVWENIFMKKRYNLGLPFIMNQLLLFIIIVLIVLYSFYDVWVNFGMKVLGIDLIVFAPLCAGVIICALNPTVLLRLNTIKINEYYSATSEDKIEENWK